MPAYFDTGFSVREPAWHRQGLVLDEYPEDWADAREKAGLEWEPMAIPLYAAASPVARDETARSEEEEGIWAEPAGKLVLPDVGTVNAVTLPDHKLIVRDDTRAPLGVVGQGYELVSHAAMGEIIEAILETPNVKFETAGSCKGGAQVWALAYLDEPYSVVGDNTETYPFLAVLNAHDGSGACKVVNTQVRVVCWNTYHAASAEGERTGRQFSFNHTAKVMDRIDEAKKAIAGLRPEADAWQKVAAELFGMPVEEAHFNHFLSEFIPEPEADVVSDRVRSNIERARGTFRSLYFDSVTTESHRGTALGLVDAATEYLDHVRGFRNTDSYLGRSILKNDGLKGKAMAIARRVCS